MTERDSILMGLETFLQGTVRAGADVELSFGPALKKVANSPAA